MILIQDKGNDYRGEPKKTNKIFGLYESNDLSLQRFPRKTHKVWTMV